jgi:hypothetical protein
MRVRNFVDEAEVRTVYAIPVKQHGHADMSAPDFDLAVTKPAADGLELLLLSHLSYRRISTRSKRAEFA